MEKNPGPISCPRCTQTFNRQSRLDVHLTKQQYLQCEHCNKNFCSQNQLHQHIRTEHIGSGAEHPVHAPTDMTVPIFGTTGYETQPGYRDIMEEHEDVIHTQTHNRRDRKKQNIQIQPEFSFGDLRSILDDVMTG